MKSYYGFWQKKIPKLPFFSFWNAGTSCFSFVYHLLFNIVCWWTAFQEKQIPLWDLLLELILQTKYAQVPKKAIIIYSSHTCKKYSETETNRNQ